MFRVDLAFVCADNCALIGETEERTVLSQNDDWMVNSIKACVSEKRG